MGDHQRRGGATARVGPAGAAVAEAGEDLGLHDGVHRAGGVVEHQHPRAAGQGPGQGDALALPAREGHAPLADHGVPALGELVDEARRLGDGGGVGDHGGIGVAVEVDVVDEPVGEEERLLEHERHRGPQLGRIGLGHVHAPDPHGAGGGLDEADEQLAQRRLAAAGGADEGDDLAGGDREGDLVERGRAVGVHEGHALEVEAHRPGGQVGALARRRGRLGGQHAVDAVGGRHRPGQLLEEEAHDAHREGQPAEEGHGLDEVPGVEPPGIELPGADQQQDDDAQVGQGVDPRLEGGPDAPDLDPGLAQGVGGAGHPVDLPVGQPEGLDHQGAVERLVGQPGHVAHPGLDLGHRHRHPVRVDAVEHGERREQHEGDEGQDRVDEQEAEQGEGHEGEHPDAEGHRVEHLGGGQHVGIGVGQQLAGRLGPVVPQGDVDERGGHPPPQLGGRAEGQHAGGEAAQHDRRRPQGTEGGQGQGAAHRRPGGHAVVGGEGREDQLVGDAPEHHRGGHHGRRVPGRTHDGQREDPGAPARA